MVGMNQFKCTALVGHIARCTAPYHDFIRLIPEMILIRQRQTLCIRDVMRKRFHTIDPSGIQCGNRHDALRRHFDKIGFPVAVTGLNRLSPPKPICIKCFSRIRPCCNHSGKHPVREAHIFQLNGVCSWEQVLIGEMHRHF